jgi:hypothetical protein
MNNMTTIDATIGEAIARSRFHDEIVRVIVADREAAANAVSACSQSCESTETDDLSTGNSMTDIWGEDSQGGEFRLHLVTE